MYINVHQSWWCNMMYIIFCIMMYGDVTSWYIMMYDAHHIWCEVMYTMIKYDSKWCASIYIRCDVHHKYIWFIMMYNHVTRPSHAAAASETLWLWPRLRLRFSNMSNKILDSQTLRLRLKGCGCGRSSISQPHGGVWMWHHFFSNFFLELDNSCIIHFSASWARSGTHHSPLFYHHQNTSFFITWTLVTSTHN